MKNDLGSLETIVSKFWRRLRERVKTILSPSPQKKRNTTGGLPFTLSALWKRKALIPVPVRKRPRQEDSRPIRRAPWMMLLVSAALSPTALWAAKPEVTGLLPAGGQIGQTVEVEVLGKLGTAPVKIWCDQEGVTGEASKDGKKLSLTIAPETQPGLCWIRIWNPEGSSALRPFIVGRLPEVQEKEPNEEISDAQAVEAAGSIINGRLSKAGELDTFKVTLKKGQTLIADVLANQVLGSPMDAVLQIASAKGFVLAQADDSPNFDPRVSLTAPEDGEYFVRVFAFPAQPNSSIRYSGGADYIYRLTLTTGPYVRHTLPLSIQAGGEANLTLKGWNLPENDSSIKPPAETENLVSQLPFPAALPLSLQAVDHPAFLEQDQPKPYTPPFSITGTVAEPDEVDRYQVSAKKGDSLSVRIESAALGFPLDAVLEIQDASGKSLTTTDDKSRGVSDVESTWNVPADGEYQILVSDRFQHGDWDYAYRLTIEKPTPTAKVSVATDVFTLTKEKPLEIPVSIAKSNGFDEEIKLEVTGLPEGFSVETAEGKPSEEPKEEGRRGRRRDRGRGQNSETINIKITAKTNEPFHGPLWIKAKAGEKTLSTTTPTANASTKAQHVWITYQPKK